ncbi:MAG: hypothetical protein HYW07_06310 [Candidatus Latescibacteria bacterium]|nr:hypothetical protein [Candidatus Latescibacterota bacterium]
MTEIEANAPFIHPPEWAVLERSLIALMNQSAAPLLEKYVRPDGTILWPTTEDFSSIDGLDDAYESFHNWPLFYLLGGDASFLEHTHREWEAITRQFAGYDSGHGHPMVVKEYEQGYDWMHQGEGYVFFYLLCLADPQHQRNAERARRYAGFFLGHDPAAPNYDPDKRLIRSPHNGSMGPAWRNFDKYYTRYAYSGWKPWPLPYLDIPGIQTVEDLRDPANELKMGAALVARMARGDAAVNLAATSLVANAYLAGGGEEHRVWVCEYLEAWMERARQNGGLLPDNVGLSGRIGECMEGKWYGGYYGWTWPHGWHTLGEAPLSAVENAALLWRDRSYFDFYRGQLDRLIEQGRMENGTLQVPHFYNDRGWEGYAPLSARYLAHLWTLSMAEEDLERIRRTRDHQSRDYQRVIPLFTKHSGGHEAPWLAYLMGEYPEYPAEILRHNHAQVYQRLAFMRDDTQDPSTFGDWYLQVRNPITVEGLVQLTMGGPLFNYNGGLLMVRLRYFDAQARRPGLPPEVAALVEKLEDRRAVVHLVNLSAGQERQVVVQGGAFGEHRFTQVKYRTRDRVGDLSPHWTDTQYRERVEAALEERVVEVNAKHFCVRLAPGTGVTLELGMERFANDPSYALPW